MTGADRLHTDQQVYTALEALLAQNEIEISEPLLNLVYGAYHRQKLDYIITEMDSRDGQEPTKAQMRVWISTFTEARLADLINSSVRDYKDTLDNHLESHRTPIEEAAVLRRDGDLLKQVHQNVTQPGWARWWSGVGASVVASIIMLGALLLLYFTVVINGNPLGSGFDKKSAPMKEAATPSP